MDITRSCRCGRAVGRPVTGPSPPPDEPTSGDRHQGHLCAPPRRPRRAAGSRGSGRPLRCRLTGKPARFPGPPPSPDKPAVLPWFNTWPPTWAAGLIVKQPRRVWMVELFGSPWSRYLALPAAGDDPPACSHRGRRPSGAGDV